MLAIFVPSFSFGQEKPKVVAKYKNVARIGNFLTRWYYDLRGTSLVWKETLTLYADSTYQYIYRGGECGTFDEDRMSTWTVNGDTLKLETNLDGFIQWYIMSDSKLYDIQADISANRKNWRFK